MMTIPLSIYVHFPWCIEKCPYCDFNSYKYREKDDFLQYTDALCADIIASAKSSISRKIISIFMGGGTPSLFPVRCINRVLQTIYREYDVADDCEITMEMNPNTRRESLDHMHEVRATGINRLSIGAQSFSNVHLKRLGRTHQACAIEQTFLDARQGGFTNINIDLMYGLPQQTLDEAMTDLDKALQLKPEHLSWYHLTIEPNTIFSVHTPTLPTDNLMFSMMEQGQNLLSKDYYNYEVSAYALSRDKICQHNRNYWLFGDYIGVGCGAHSKLSQRTQGGLQVMRYERHKTPKAYLLAPRHSMNSRFLTPKDLVFEYMLNRLRLQQSVDEASFLEHTGLRFIDCQTQLAIAVEKGLVRLEQDSFTLLPLGRRFLNDLQGLFLPE